MAKIKKGISDVEAKIVDIEMEKSRLNRQKSFLVFNKAMFFYFIVLLAAIVGFVNGYLAKFLFNVLIAMGLVVLIIGFVPYITTMKKEEKNLNNLIQDLKRKK